MGGVNHQRLGGLLLLYAHYSNWPRRPSSHHFLSNEILKAPSPFRTGIATSNLLKQVKHHKHL